MLRWGEERLFFFLSHLLEGMALSVSEEQRCHLAVGNWLELAAGGLLGAGAVGKAMSWPTVCALELGMRW